MMHLERCSRTLILSLVVATAILAGCTGGADNERADDIVPAPVVAGADEPTEVVEVVDFVAEAEDFVNLADMTQVRGMFISNPLGLLDEAVSVAENPEGGVFPVGTIIQLVPQEAMVKRAPGFDSASNDWEFFELDVTTEGTLIRVRGGAEVINRFGGSCVDCHAMADERFDMICEKDRGCDPLPVDDDFFEALRVADPRPSATSSDGP